MEPLRRAFRGYDASQVDRLVADLNARIDGLSRETERLETENRRLAAERDALRASAEETSRDEEALKEALVGAHRQSEEILSGARKEAETLLQVAREAGARMQDDLKGRIVDLNWQIERLSLQKHRFVAEIKDLLERQLAELSSPESSEPRLFGRETAGPIQLEEIHPAAVAIEDGAPSEEPPES
jgi:cell division initiation protein